MFLRALLLGCHLCNRTHSYSFADQSLPYCLHVLPQGLHNIIIAIIIGCCCATTASFSKLLILILLLIHIIAIVIILIIFIVIIVIIILRSPSTLQSSPFYCHRQCMVHTVIGRCCHRVYYYLLLLLLLLPTLTLIAVIIFSVFPSECSYFHQTLGGNLA